MVLINYLAIIAVLVFIILILIRRNKIKTYLLFVIYFLPLINIPITPASLGSLKVFDGISYIILVLAFKQIISVNRKSLLYLRLFLALILILFIGSITSEFVFNSLVNILSIFPVFIFSTLMIRECVKNKDFEKKVITAIKYAGIFSIFFLVLQILVGLDFTFYSELNPNTTDPSGNRYPSFFHDPQLYAQFLAMLSFLFLINYDYVRGRLTIIKGVSFLIIIVAILFTGGRSGFLGISIGFFILFLFFSLRNKVIVLTFLIIGASILMTFSSAFVTLKRNADFSGDYNFRFAIWKGAYDIFNTHPLGIGIGNYLHFVKYYSTDQYFVIDDNEIEYFDQPENGYLKILVEYGILGFVITLLLIFMPIIISIKKYFEGYRDQKIFFYIAGILSFLISFTSIYTLSDKRILVIFVSLLCFLIASSNRPGFKYER